MEGRAGYEGLEGPPPLTAFLVCRILVDELSEQNSRGAFED